MRRLRWWVAAVSLAGLMLTGCQDSKPAAPAAGGDGETASPTAGDGTAESVAKTPGQDAVKPKLPVLETADSLEGNWVLSPYISRRFINFWLFRLAPGEDGKWTIETIANQPMMGQFTPGTVKVDGDAIEFDVQINNPKAQVKQATLSFQGRLKEGKVYGNMMFSDSGMLAATQLLPTDADTLEGYLEASEVEGAAEIDQVMKEPDPGRNLWQLARSRLTSPLAAEAFGFLFAQVHQWNFTDKEIEDLAADYTQALSHWGRRMQGVSEVTAGSNLARHKKALDVADKLMTAGEGLLEDKKISEGLIKGGRLHLRIARDLLAITGKDEAAAKTAYDDLQDLNQEMPYIRPDLLLATAEYAEKHDQKDAAIEQYLILVAMPLLERMALSTRIGMVAGDPTPTSALKALWQEKHGSLEGIEAAVIETYRTHLGKVLAEIKEKAPPFPEPDAEGKNRVVLTEVFTGTFCDACVASDLAVDLLVETQPADRSIILCYHQHNPGPDPLTSGDSEQRGTYYNIQGTPFAYVNGVQIGGVGGLFGTEFLHESYLRYRQPIDFFLKKPTEIKIAPKAEVADGTLTVDIPAITGLSEEDLANVRLRLAIAEEHVDYRAPNGIRQHPMVVRTMLGGAKGIVAKQGELKYHLSMPVAELKGRQLAYLHQYEHGKRMKFPKKPAEMKHLRLVAFVQNDKTKEVLQAAWAPVTGEWEYPEINFDDHADHGDAPADSAEKNSAKKNSDEKNNAEKKPEEKSPESKAAPDEAAPKEESKEQPKPDEKPAGEEKSPS